MIWNRLNREKNQIFDFSDFHFSSYGYFFTRNDPNFRRIFTHSSKNINCKKILFHFSFYSAHSAPVIKMWPFLRGGGSAYPQLGKSQFELCLHTFMKFLSILRFFFSSKSRRGKIFLQIRNSDRYIHVYIYIYIYKVAA